MTHSDLSVFTPGESPSGILDMSGILDGMEPITTRHNMYPSALAGAMKAALGDRALLDTTKEPLLDQLGFLADVQKSLAHELPKTVKKLRSRGASWDEIGNALGTSRQAAWERFK